MSSDNRTDSQDLGLLSTTMVFESIAVLEEFGFFMRSRQALPESHSRRNVYRRTACEYTVLRLLETNRIDGQLRPVCTDDTPDDARQLIAEGLQALLGDRYQQYENAAEEEKRDVLVAILKDILRSRPGRIYLC